VAAFGVPAIAAFALALVGPYRPEVCAIIGGFLLVVAVLVRTFQRLFPAVEWAINRRLSDYVVRARIQAESFDGTWNSIRDSLRTHTEWLVRHNAEIAELTEFRDRLKAELDARNVKFKSHD
jgi:hypothetical protein